MRELNPDPFDQSAECCPSRHNDHEYILFFQSHIAKSELHLCRMCKDKLSVYGLPIMGSPFSFDFIEYVCIILYTRRLLIFNEILVVVVYDLALYARHHVFTSVIPRYTHLILSTKKKIILKKV